MTEKQLSLLIHGAGESGYVVQEVYLSLEDFDELRGDTGCARGTHIKYYRNSSVTTITPSISVSSGCPQVVLREYVSPVTDLGGFPSV